MFILMKKDIYLELLSKMNGQQSDLYFKFFHIVYSLIFIRVFLLPPTLAKSFLSPSIYPDIVLFEERQYERL